MTSSTINPDTITGVEVTGNGGNKLATVDDLYIDNETHQPELVAVKSGLFGTHVCLVPIGKAQFDGTVLSVPFAKEQLKPLRATTHDGSSDPKAGPWRGWDARIAQAGPRQWVDATFLDR
jgi:hypothetical protein